MNFLLKAVDRHLRGSFEIIIFHGKIPILIENFSMNKTYLVSCAATDSKLNITGYILPEIYYSPPVRCGNKLALYASDFADRRSASPFEESVIRCRLHVFPLRVIISGARPPFNHHPGVVPFPIPQVTHAPGSGLCGLPITARNQSKFPAIRIIDNKLCPCGNAQGELVPLTAEAEAAPCPAVGESNTAGIFSALQQGCDIIRLILSALYHISKSRREYFVPDSFAVQIGFIHAKS